MMKRRRMKAWKSRSNGPCETERISQHSGLTLQFNSIRSELDLGKMFVPSHRSTQLCHLSFLEIAIA